MHEKLKNKKMTLISKNGHNFSFLGKDGDNNYHPIHSW